MATLADLTPDPHNARRHTPRNVGTIVDSLHAVGTGRSVVIDEDGVILAGNATVEAAAQAGIERVQIVDSDGETLIAVRRTGLTPAQKTRLALADNRAAELADWDIDVLAGLQADSPDLLAGLWREDELAALLAEVAPTLVPGNGGDEFDSTPADGPTRVQSGDVWQVGPHRLMCGDSTDPDTLALLMGDKRAQLAVTSPPYNQQIDTFRPSGMHKEGDWVAKVARLAYADNLPEDEYQQAQAAALELWHAVLADNASLFYNHKNRYRDKQVVSPLRWLPGPFRFRQEIIWSRPGSVTQNARMFLPSDERIYWLYKGDDFYFDDSTDHKSWSTVWDIRLEVNKEHAVAFPLELPTRPIAACSKPGDLVVDFYLGSGTTLVAAHRLGRVCYGCEISPAYCDVILRRAEAEGIGPIVRVEA